MKRLLSIIVALVFVFTFCISVAYADNSKNPGKGNSGDKALHKTVAEQMKDLKEQFKNYCKDVEKRDKILEEIAKLKKKNKDTTISVFVNGQEVTCDTPPVIKYGKVLLPVKPITKALGAKLTYDPKTGVIVITKDDIKITIKIGSNVAIVNNVKTTLEYKVELGKNGIMIPMGVISKILKQKVDYDDDSGTVIIDNGTIMVNDNVVGLGNKQFEYVGSWSYGTQSGAYLGDNHWSGTANDYVNFRFSGTKIKLYGAKAPSHGIAAISIDGGTEIIVDYYSVNRADNALIFESPVLTAGQHTLKVRVTGSKRNEATNTFVTIDRVELKESSQSLNLALNKQVTASSFFTDASNVSYGPANAVDGNAGTSWISQYSDPQWISVDLGQVKTVNRIRLDWGAQYAKVYVIQVSTTNADSSWSTVYSTGTGDGAIDDVAFNPVQARYVKVIGLERATQYGYMLKELEVYEGTVQPYNGSLTGSISNITGNINLSTEGTIDWAHWGYNDVAGFNHKNGVTQQISNYTRVGTGTAALITGNPAYFSWTDGTPNAAVTNYISSVYYAGKDNGFQFTVPADMNLKTLKVYAAAWNAKGKLTASLSDNSAPVYTAVIDSPSSVSCKAFTLSFKAASAGQTLTIRYITDSTYGSDAGYVSLQAATLK